MIKYLIPIINKSSIMVGGQAVIEGVMMRVPGFYATAVRNPQGIIEVERHEFKSLVDQYKLNKFFIIRGFVHLIDSMKIGFKTLEWSASIADLDSKDHSKPNKILEFIMSIIAIAIPISIFYAIPFAITGIFNDNIINNQFLFNSIAGCTRIILFIFYLLAISQLKDINRLFQYHGAEHKVVYNFESGQKLNIKNAQEFSTLHPRCGTSFVFILMLTAILFHGIIDSIIFILFDLKELTVFQRVFAHLFCLPLIAGGGYEVLKFLAKRQKNIIVKVCSMPGLWLQKITTKQPSNKQVEVSIHALNTAFSNDVSKYEGKKFIADAIG